MSHVPKKRNQIWVCVSHMISRLKVFWAEWMKCVAFV